MKNKILLILIGAQLLLSACVQSSSDSEKVEQLEQEVAELRTQMASYQTSLDQIAVLVRMKEIGQVYSARFSDQLPDLNRCLGQLSGGSHCDEISNWQDRLRCYNAQFRKYLDCEHDLIEELKDSFDQGGESPFDYHPE